MAYVLNILVKFIYIYILNIDLRRTVHQVMEDSSDTTELIVISVKGFKTTFTCQRIKYIVSYENSLLLNEEFKIYKLSAEHNDSVPLTLKEVLSEPHYLPSFKEIMISEEYRRKIMIEAYVDLVTRKIDNK